MLSLLSNLTLIWADYYMIAHNQIKIKKSFVFYHALKGVVCLGLLDAQDANSMLKHGVFVKHLDTIISNTIFLFKSFRHYSQGH